MCRVIGNVHTFASVYWYVVGGEYELGVYADGGHIVVYAGSVMLRGKNVIWCVGRVL